MSNRDHVSAHYGKSGLLDRLLEALAAAGKSPDHPSVDDLAPADQFHLRGRDATQELVTLAGVTAADRVLDVGGGIGGPARSLAADVGCRVTVLDLTEEFCRVGAALTERTGLAERVSFRHGSALEMPFDAGAFDVAWTQHSSMNIEDKETLYREIARVVRPGGRLAIHEIFAGTQSPIHFPVPWAGGDPSISFLRPADSMRSTIAGAGFRERVWRDASSTAIAWLRERLAAAASAPPSPLGLGLLLGPEAPLMLKNVLRNLEEQRITVVLGVWERS
jgi:sarcosine/dimethylglycine N-methyltransferase